MTFDRWLTPLQNHSWADIFTRRGQHQTIDREYVTRQNKINTKVLEQDRVNVQLKHQKIVQRATAAKMAARGEAPNSRFVKITSQMDSQNSQAGKGQRKPGRLLGIVQPAGLDSKKKSKRENVRSASPSRLRKPRKTTSAAVLIDASLIPALKHEEQKRDSPKGDEKETMSQKEQKLDKISVSLSVEEGSINSIEVSNPIVLNASIESPSQENKLSHHEAEQSLETITVPTEEKKETKKQESSQALAVFASPFAKRQLLKSKFSLEKRHRRPQTFASQSSCSGSEAQEHMELHSELDRFFEAQADIIRHTDPVGLQTSSSVEPSISVSYTQEEVKGRNDDDGCNMTDDEDGDANVVVDENPRELAASRLFELFTGAMPKKTRQKYRTGPGSGLIM